MSNSPRSRDRCRCRLTSAVPALLVALIATAEPGETQPPPRPQRPPQTPRTPGSTVAPPTLPKNFRVADCPVCTEQMMAEWTRVRADQLGVDAVDPDGHWIGPYPARKRNLGPADVDVGPNWWPADVYKKVGCGTLDHYGWYDGSGAEADWNLYLVPSRPFAFLIEELRPYEFDPVGAGGWHNRECRGGATCMEGEVTPDQSLYNNAWFPPNDHMDSPLAGRSMCVYGPWIGEYVHGNRPEIHPSEMIWWSERWPDVGAPGNRALVLALLQDDSNRFDRRSWFAPAPDPPPQQGWRPWSQYPRRGQFALAFTARTDGGEPVRVDVRRTNGFKVTTGAGDMDDGHEHAVEFGDQGTVVLEVRERRQDDDDVRVALDTRRLCRNGNQIYGYVLLTATVGVGDEGGEGYLLAWVNLREQGDAGRDPPPPSPTPGPDRPPTDPRVPPGGAIPLTTPQARTTPTAEPVAGTLRRQQVNGRPSLVADLELRAQPNGPAPAAVARATARARTVAGGPTADTVALTTRATGGRPRLVGVPVGGGGTIDVAFAGGRTASVAVPEFGLRPAGRTVVRSSVPDPAAWRSVAVAAGAASNIAAAGGRPVHALRQVRLHSAVAYAAKRGGRGEPDDDESPLVAEMNAALAPAARRAALFGLAQPFTATWTFRATDLGTGADVPVAEGRAPPPGGVRVDLRAETATDNVAEITFPTDPAGGPARLIELRAVTTVRDPYGSTGESRQTVWSHAIPVGDSGADALGFAAALASVPAGPLAARGSINRRPNEDPTITDPAARRARAAQLWAMRASADSMLTIGELRTLRELARVAAP